MELSLRVERYRGKPWPQGEEVVFTDRGGSIGRNAENFLVLPDPSRQISGRHAFVLLRGRDFYIVDTGQNGVFLNGSPDPLGWCRTAKLEHGDTIAIGEYLLRASVRKSAEDGNAALEELPLAGTVLLPAARARRLTGAGAPATPAEPPPEPAAPPAPAHGPPAAEPPASQRPSADALVVDDDEEVSYLVKFMLERAGYTVTLAHDGLGAKAILDTQAPTRLVVLDIMLPHLDGFQLIDIIRNSPRWSAVPVIVLSAMTAERDIIRALNSGANDYVEKPFKPAELVARLKRFLT